MGRIRKYRPTDRWTDTQKQNASDHGYHQRGGIKSPANCKIQRHLSGCDRLNPHCVNKFCKGLNVKEVNLFAKASHCRFNMELTMVSYSIKWVEILRSVSFFVFGLCRKKKKVLKSLWEKPYSHEIAICNGIFISY